MLLAQKNLDRLVNKHKNFAQYRLAKYKELKKVIAEKLNAIKEKDRIRA